MTLTAERKSKTGNHKAKRRRKCSIFSALSCVSFGPWRRPAPRGDTRDKRRADVHQCWNSNDINGEIGVLHAKTLSYTEIFRCWETNDDFMKISPNSAVIVAGPQLGRGIVRLSDAGCVSRNSRRREFIATAEQ